MFYNNNYNLNETMTKIVIYIYIYYKYLSIYTSNTWGEKKKRSIYII